MKGLQKAKKLSALLLTFAMCMSVLPQSAYAMAETPVVAEAPVENGTPAKVPPAEDTENAERHEGASTGATDLNLPVQMYGGSHNEFYKTYIDRHPLTQDIMGAHNLPSFALFSDMDCKISIYGTDGISLHFLMTVECMARV